MKKTFLTLALCLSLCTAALLSQAAHAAQRVTTSEAAKLLAAPPADLVVLDVRTPKEFATGHLAGAVNMDIFDPQFATKLRELSRDKTYVVYCRTDSRSGQAVEMMDKADFSKVILIEQGIMGWNREQLPITQ